MDWFPWYPALYRADTLDLTLEQDGAYRRLIDHYMETRLSLPDNDTALARIIGISTKEFQAIAEQIRCKFKAIDGELHSKRCDIELNRQDALSKKRSNVAKAAHKKRNKNKTNGANAKQVPGNSTDTGQDKTGQDKEITSSGEIETSTEASEPSPPPPDDAVEGKAESSEPDDKPEAPDKDMLDIPDSLRRAAPLEAKDFIGLFDDLIETHFGANKRRPWPNQGDYATAKAWLDNGADLTLIENVVGAAMAGMAGRGREAPGTLNYFTKPVSGAIRGMKEPLPDVAATRGAQGPGLHADAETSKWAARLQGYREKGFWLASYGPEPGQPGCEVPAKLLEKENR